MQSILKESDARLLLSNACKRMNLPEPSLAWTHTSRGWYHYSSGLYGLYPEGRIKLGPNCRGVMTLIHELAHHHDHIVHGTSLRRRYDPLTHKRKNAKHHGPSFVKSLILVATDILGDPLRYDWQTEYLSLQGTADVLRAAKAASIGPYAQSAETAKAAGPSAG